LDRLHISHIVHDLEFLHQIVLHSFFDHVAASEIPPNTSLDDVHISFYHYEDVTVDLHSEEGLDCGGGHVKAVDFAADD